MTLAKIIVVEGADRVGKATQSRILADALTNVTTPKLWLKTAKVARVEVPFNDHVSHKLIYWMLGNGLAKTFPTLFQFVHFVNKLVFQFTYLLFLRLWCDYVVLDRWRLSAYVYGTVSGVNKTLSLAQYRCLAKPDITILITGTSYRRNEKKDCYEADNDFQKTVKQQYVRCAFYAMDEKFIIANNDQHNSITKMHKFIVKNLKDQKLM